MKRDYTEGSVFKNLLIFSVPYLLACFLQTFYGLGDLFIVGQFDGYEAPFGRNRRRLHDGRSRRPRKRAERDGRIDPAFQGRHQAESCADVGRHKIQIGRAHV